ncbi:MAG TPA: hypothetical protein DCW90_11335 [Lachnospiraceae bacterium]|nr:hypothetical protein [Lachnospiraceae bacterium]
MSLDLYIESKTPVLHRGTGVYIRENGETRELTTKQEVLTYFPDINPEEISETSYESNDYFHMNLTHNLTEMASQCRIIGTCNEDSDSGVVTLHDLLWHPEDRLHIITPNMDYLQDVMACYRKLLENPDFFKQYNPDNGWGTFEQLLKKTKLYANALMSVSDNFENYTIRADV